MALHLRNGEFRDSEDRQVLLRGINFAADAKFPYHPNTDSYVDSPLPLADADEHYQRLRDLGFNCIRYIYTWDALEHAGPGKYDEEYIDYTIAMIKKAIDYGFYVFMDPHQDVWSRFTGGSGAPLWTLHAVGFHENELENTHASMLYHKDDTNATKMLWSSNYGRLLNQTMWTLFFAGEDFAPNCTLNGVNVGAYLQQHFLDAVAHFAGRVQKADLGPRLIGWESINEPSEGLIGMACLDKLPEALNFVKLETAPTPLQAMLLGAGMEQTCERYRFTGFGIRKDDPLVISPKRPVWLNKDELAAVDAKHGWTRSWASCVWAHEGVYDPTNGKLLKPNYFTNASGRALDERSFVDDYFVRHWDLFTKIIRTTDEWFVFMQAPVNVAPPDLRHRLPDPSFTVYSPHYYDGLTLMLKKWRSLNVDAVGMLRKKYSSPVAAVRFGSRAIRSCFVSQLSFVKQEGRQRLGMIPTVMSEIGIPYDMDDKRSFASGNYENQVRAMDANHHGLESAQMSHALWTYTACNTHQYGDLWNGEDLSIWSADDAKRDAGMLNTANKDPGLIEALGVRAAPAVIRPVPLAVAGQIASYSFDIYKAVFTLQVDGRAGTTLVYLPNYYYGEQAQISVSSGDVHQQGQVLQWQHGDGRHRLVARSGTPRFSDSVYSYFEPVVRVFQEGRFELGKAFRR